MAPQREQLDVMTVIATRKMVHGEHPTQATKPKPAHIIAALEAEDLMSCVGKAQLTEDGTLLIQLSALPVNGRLLIRLRK
jgi:hypothetical protein